MTVATHALEISTSTPDKPVLLLEIRTHDCSSLERAIHAIQDRGQTVDPTLLEHLSPLGWEHINLTGDYVWRHPGKAQGGKFRPLRPFPPA